VFPAEPPGAAHAVNRRADSPTAAIGAAYKRRPRVVGAGVMGVV
jgi:hypothetical protein